MSLFVTFGVNAQTKDFVILGGELSNSAATSVSDIDEVLPRMKALGLNTVLVPVYWEFLEPVEGSRQDYAEICKNRPDEDWIMAKKGNKRRIC